MANFTRQALAEGFTAAVYRKRKAMSEAQRRRKPKLGTFTTWLYPHGVERRYFAFIRGLMKQVSGDYLEVIAERLPAWLAEENVLALFGDSDGEFLDAYEDEFAELMNGLRERHDTLFTENENGVKANILGYGQQVDDFNATQWNKITSLAIGTAYDIDSGWVQGMLRNWTNLNYTLIKSLSDEQIKKVNTIVAEGVQQGRLYTDIMKDLRKMDKNMSNARARLIARDQVGKLNGSLMEGRQLDAGVTEYVWTTSMDERVRSSHQKMNGSINKWDDRTVFKPRGERKFRKRSAEMQGAIPGSQIQCRCAALPAFDDIVEDVDNLIREEEGIAAPPPPPEPPKRPKRKPKPRPAPVSEEAAAVAAAAKTRKTKPQDKAPKKYSFKNTEEAREVIEKFGPRLIEGKLSTLQLETLAEALNRAPADTDFGALTVVGDTNPALKAMLSRKKGGRATGMWFKNFRGQGVTLHAGQLGKTDKAMALQRFQSKTDSLQRRGFRFGASQKNAGTAHHEVAHYMFENKFGYGSDLNRALKKDWRAALKEHWPPLDPATIPGLGDRPSTDNAYRAFRAAKGGKAAREKTYYDTLAKDLEPYEKKLKKFNDDRIRKGLGEIRPMYSRSDDDEAFSEAWAMYVNPDERKRLPKGIVDWIQKNIDN